jgi:hypothetical protein
MYYYIPKASLAITTVPSFFLSIRFGILSHRSEAKALLIHRGPPCPLHPRGLYSVTGLGIRHASVARDIGFCTHFINPTKLLINFIIANMNYACYPINGYEDKLSYVHPLSVKF